MRKSINVLWVLLILLVTFTARGACPPAGTSLVSKTAGGQAGNATSEAPWISDDGRYILFHSEATNIGSTGAPNPPGGYNLYLWDRVANSYMAVDQTGWDSGLGEGRLSGDGNSISFVTSTDDILGPADGNAETDVFVMNRTTRAIERVSVPDRDIQEKENIHHTVRGNKAHAISANGNVVVFFSTSLVLTRDYFGGLSEEQAANSFPHALYARDRANKRTHIVVRGTIPANSTTRENLSGTIGRPAISADGQTIVFASNATNIEGVSSLAGWWLYRAVFNGSAWQVQERIAAVHGSYADSIAISPDARYVAYVAPLPDEKRDLLIRDLLLGTTINPRGSFANPAGREPGTPFLTNRGIAWEDGIDYTGHGTYGSYYLDFTAANAQHVRLGINRNGSGVRGASPTPPVVSADARWMVFDTDDGNVAGTDGNNIWDVFVQEQTSLCTTPAARFTFSCTSLSCSFDATASTDDGSIFSYDWQFGDGTAASGQTAQHSYLSAGSRIVTLTVTDAQQGSTQAAKLVVTTDDPASPALSYVPVAPCRLLDTRNGSAPAHDVPFTLNVVNTVCGTHAGARAVSLNVTVLTPTGNGHLKMYASDRPSSTSVVNFTAANTPRANNAIVPVAADGTIAIKPFVAGSGTVQVLVDVNGYFTEASGLGFAPLTPFRLYDSRNDAPLANGTIREVLVQGNGGVPANAAAASLNVTALAMTAQGHFKTYAAGAALPGASQINFKTDRFAIANGARVPLGANGMAIQSAITNGGTAQVIVDVNGYFKDDAPLRYYPVTPCRALDTRSFPQGPALGNGETRLVQIRGNCGVPADAKVAMVNLTALQPTTGGNVLAWQTGVTRPLASTINMLAGEVAIANGTIVQLSQSYADDLSLFATLPAGGTAHVIVDVFGYFK
ncbi:MAG TPA: PKD domain-containing protein [Thermoanaerobaculia bacterium]